MQDKKAQSLIVVLWILIILTMLALSLGQRVAMSLRLSKYQRDKLKAYCLAQTGLNKTIIQLNKDMLEDNGEDGLVILVKDEESKININTASRNLLIGLLGHCEIAQPERKADNILIWRGDISDQLNIYINSGYPAKTKKFSNAEELMLVKDITAEDCDKLKEFITVYGDTNKPSVNINTAPLWIITILAEATAQSLEEKNSVSSIISKIGDLRKKGLILKEEDIKIETIGNEEDNLFNRLKDNLIPESNFFRINAQGKVNNITSEISVVYDRPNSKIIYWHES